MKGSPFAKFMLPEIDAWEKVLMATSDNLDVWLQVQQVWMALEPVFSSEDIIQQMPKEGRIFRQVDKMWEKLMGRIAANPAALAVVAIDDLGATLRSCDAKLLLHRIIYDTPHRPPPPPRAARACDAAASHASLAIRDPRAAALHASHRRSRSAAAALLARSSILLCIYSS